MKRFITILLLVVMTALCLSACNSRKYDDAFELINNGDYDAAFEIFSELGDYKNAREELENFYYVPTKIVVIAENSEKDEIGDMTVSYNENNLPSRVIVSNNTQNAIIYYSCDEKGNIVKIVQTSPAGDKSTYEYIYDSNNNCIKTVFTDSEGNKSITDSIFDENGRVVRRASTHPNTGDDTIYYNDYIYDEIGNLIKQVSSNSKGNSNDSYTDYTYDAKGNLIKKVWNVTDDVKEIEEYTYDENGNLLKQEKTYISGSKSVYEYKYDEKGNLIEKNVTDSNGEKQILELTYKLVYTKIDFSFESFLESILIF